MTDETTRMEEVAPGFFEVLPVDPFPDWKITRDQDGTVHAIGPLPLMILPDGEARAFKRRAWSVSVTRDGVGQGAREKARWLVGELDGVRVYTDGRRIVMTRQDLFP